MKENLNNSAPGKSVSCLWGCLQRSMYTWDNIYVAKLVGELPTVDLQSVPVVPVVVKVLNDQSQYEIYIKENYYAITNLALTIINSLYDLSPFYRRTWWKDISEILPGLFIWLLVEYIINQFVSGS